MKAFSAAFKRDFGSFVYILLGLSLGACVWQWPVETLPGLSDAKACWHEFFPAGLFPGSIACFCCWTVLSVPGDSNVVPFWL